MEKRYYYLVTPLVYTGSAAAFTYHYDSLLPDGQVVNIPVGRRNVLGVVEQAVGKPEFNTKPISGALELPAVPADLRELARWLAEYYASSPASVWSTMLPSGLAKTRRATTKRKPTVAQGVPKQPLTTEQTTVINAIRNSSKASHLIQGVTGSGKTRIYLELAAEALASGRSVIVLVPEITLTPQIVSQFESAFGDVVLASHSKLTEAQRHNIWTLANAATAAGKPRVIIGPRSCLFMPLHDLGLVIVDECHETSYKQEQHPRYNAVTAAAKRAQITGAKLILGSATPGLNELYLAKAGRIEHHILKYRTNEIPHSKAIIIDLRNKDLFGLSKFITQPLYDAVAETMADGRQTLLYMNRRGSASSQICGDCGHVTTCPNCQLPLTFHEDLMRLVCHHCNYRVTNGAVCPECNGSNLRLLGGGTKRIEAEAIRLFPGARIARLDRDSATLSNIKAVIGGLKKREIDIVIGTQMIAKGLDLPAIDTVGVVSADTMLHLPDYTAAERTYQLLSQVSGRAGRGDRAGRVYIQTYTPDHPAIVAASTGSYDAFAGTELMQRQAMSYPPYVYMLKLTFAGPSREVATSSAIALAEKLRGTNGVAVSGPAPAFIENQSGKFHWIITVKAKNRPDLVNVAAGLPSDKWTADLDPINLL